MNVLFSWALIAAGIRFAVPVALAALGSVVSERSGVLNLGLEGMMLSGALSAYLVTLHSGSPWVGLLGGTVTGALCGCILAFLVVSIRANQIVTGIAFTLLAGSATTYIYKRSYAIGQSPPRIPRISMPPLVAVVVALVAAVWFVLNRATIGLALSAAGEKPQPTRAATG